MDINANVAMPIVTQPKMWIRYIQIQNQMRSPMGPKSSATMYSPIWCGENIQPHHRSAAAIMNDQPVKFVSKSFFKLIFSAF